MCIRDRKGSRPPGRNPGRGHQQAEPSTEQTLTRSALRRQPPLESLPSNANSPQARARSRCTRRAPPATSTLTIGLLGAISTASTFAYGDLRSKLPRFTEDARAANPDWAKGMMNHGFRGGAEIAATLDHMAAFAHLAQVVPPHLFDLYHDATLGRDEVRDFLNRENPAALAAMEDLFRRLRDAGLWQTRRNSIAARLDGAA